MAWRALLTRWLYPGGFAADATSAEVGLFVKDDDASFYRLSMNQRTPDGQRLAWRVTVRLTPRQVQAICEDFRVAQTRARTAELERVARQ